MITNSWVCSQFADPHRNKTKELSLLITATDNLRNVLLSIGLTVYSTGQNKAVWCHASKIC